MEQAANKQFVELERTHFWFVARRRIFFSVLDDLMLGRGSTRILDVGCGAGGMLEPLSRYGELTGVDLSPELVELCHQRGFPNVVVGSAYELPAEDESIGLVTLFDTIEHVQDDARVLREVRRVLSPGGLLFISTPAYQFLFANNDRVAHHIRRYTASVLRRRLLAAGLRPVKVSYFNTLLFPAILPAVLAKKLAERIRDPGEVTNLSHPVGPLLNRGLAAIMGSERHLLAHANMPFGHSLIAVATTAALGDG